MKDPVFQKQLDDQQKADKSLRSKYVKTRKAYEEAAAADPNGPKAQALKKELEQLEAAHRANLRQTQKIVRERLRPSAPKTK